MIESLDEGIFLNRKPEDILLGPRGATAEFPMNEELAFKDRALAAAAEGITIADARLPDNPLIYINAGFERLTGYSAQSMLGKNCRFLQGSHTDSAARNEIRRALEEKRECTVEILNYRKDGTPFWNRLSITPVHDASGQVTHYIGIQSDITARKTAEEKLIWANEKLEEANQRMKRELEIAARIQQSLLPPSDFKVPGVSLSWFLKPCDELAGDTLNVLRLDKDHLGLYMIDVSGHGVGSSLLSFTLNRWMSPVPDHSSLFGNKANSPRHHQLVPPAQIAHKLNQQFPMDPETAQYFTFFYGILNLKTGLFRYVNAGHPNPIYLPFGSEPALLPSSGCPIGLLRDAIYEDHTVTMRTKDRLVLYTDGLIESFNPLEEEFGLGRLLENVSSTRGLGLDESLKILAKCAADWHASSSQRDDISLLAFDYKP
jgi:sigma-B regulation protein RsbU (phosphoserine phosphatase)